MAIVGRKPKPPGLKMVQGNPGRRPLPEADIDMREGALAPPAELSDRQKALWSRYIDTAWWLEDYDAPKAYIWVCLQIQFQDDPEGLSAARIANLRAVGSELGLDPSARARMSGPKGGEDPTDEFFH